VRDSQWKVQALENMAGGFESPRKKASKETDWKKRESHLFRKIGQLEVERDWWKKNLRSLASFREEKRAMIEDNHPRLSVTRQCRLVALACSTDYCRPKGFPKKDAALCNRIDEIQTDYRFFGTGQMRNRLRLEGWKVGRKCRISMGGRGRALDNVFVERPWRSLKRRSLLPVVSRCRRSEGL